MHRIYIEKPMIRAKYKAKIVISPGIYGSVPPNLYGDLPFEMEYLHP